MRKLLFILLPVVIVGLFAARAFTSPDTPAPPERAIKEVIAIGDGGYRIGVVLAEINPHLRDKLNIDTGILVDDVLEDSPAEKAGIKEGDIIVKVDGKAVSDEKDLRRPLREMEEAKAMNLEVLRDGKTLNISVMPEKRGINIMRHFGGRNYIGVELQELNPDLAPYFQVDPGAGVLITRVVSASPAEKAGIHSGDVVTALNGKKVTSPEMLRDELQSVKEGESASLTLLRRGKEQKLSVKPESGGFAEFRHLRELRDLPEIPPLPDMPEMKDTMRDLEREMDKLKEEIQQLKLEDIQQLKEELRKEMEQVKKELEKIRESD
jgi:membrane-associated protease RseP (regulator of RpoE activity)